MSNNNYPSDPFFYFVCHMSGNKISCRRGDYTDFQIPTLPSWHERGPGLTGTNAPVKAV